MTIAPATVPPGTYPPAVRSAWLDLYGDGTVTVPLEDYGRGYFCSNLDLGAPAVRAVVYNRPDAHGEVDLTQYFGGRVVTINLSAYAGAGAQIDAIPSLFGKFSVPSARPVLHFILNRPGVAERTLALRPSAFSWPITAPDRRDVQLQFEAADPVIRDVAVKQATAWSGSTVGAGRTYNLTFNRVYPAGGGAQVNATVQTNGDVALSPLVRIYGPITTPQVGFSLQVASTQYALYFVSGFRIDVGHRVDVDCAGRSAFYDGDPTQSVLSSIDWRYFNQAGYVPSWPLIPPAPESAVLTLSGTSTSSSTQAVAIWQDGYLT